MSIEASIERVHLLNKETLIVSDINIDFREKLGYGKHRLAKGLRNLHSKQLVDFITRPVNGAECDPCNYRPISVLPVLSRVIERHVHILCTFLCDNNLIFLRQSGFRKNLRTETALIRIIDDLFNLDKDRVSGVVLIDYCKAFYIVDHELLLKKLEAYGIVNTELKWCRSYLTGRKQVVHLSGK